MYPCCALSKRVLVDQVDEAVQASGLPPVPKDEFVAHITMARVKKRRKPKLQKVWSPCTVAPALPSTAASVLGLQTQPKCSVAACTQSTLHLKYQRQISWKCSAPFYDAW